MLVVFCKRNCVLSPIVSERAKTFSSPYLGKLSPTTKSISSESITTYYAALSPIPFVPSPQSRYLHSSPLHQILQYLLQLSEYSRLPRK